MKNFESFLAPQLNKFIAYRQNLGYSVKPTRSHLLRFDRYVKDKKIKPSVSESVIGVYKKIEDNYLKSAKTAVPIAGTSYLG